MFVLFCCLKLQWFPITLSLKNESPCHDLGVHLYECSLGLIFAYFSSLVCSVYFSPLNHSYSLPCSLASVLLHTLAFLQGMDFLRLTCGGPVPSLGLRDLRDHFF